MGRQKRSTAKRFVGREDLKYGLQVLARSKVGHAAQLGLSLAAHQKSPGGFKQTQMPGPHPRPMNQPPWVGVAFAAFTAPPPPPGQCSVPPELSALSCSSPGWGGFPCSCSLQTSTSVFTHLRVPPAYKQTCEEIKGANVFKMLY